MAQMTRRLSNGQVDQALKRCLELQHEASNKHHKFPFAALLLGPDNDTILLTHFGLGSVQHAECELARSAAAQFSEDYLWNCTLVSTWEPCAMCTGTTYWANIGTVLYAASEEDLLQLTGPENKANPTMSLPCREVFARGQKDVEVVGPIPGWREKTIEESREWWEHHRLS